MGVCALAIASCKKEKPVEPVVPIATNQKISFHIHNTVGNEVLVYDKIFTDNAGKRFKISAFKYYITNIKFIKDDGSELASTTKAILVNPLVADYSLGEVPTGNYKGVKFYIGLDSITNHADPTMLDASNPLAIQTPSMHWNWNSGYIFMKFEGFSDTTATNNGAFDMPLVYHIGMDKYSKQLSFTNNAFDVKADAEEEIVLQLDIKKLLNGLDLKTETQTHSFNYSSTANKIFSNMNSAYLVNP